MTVCIAALSRFNEASIVIGASDRMITAGDIEFEPPQTKIIQLTTSIAALTAGESSAQIEISGATLRDIKARLAIDKSWMGVNEVAQMFSAQVLKYRQRVAQRKFLEPFGLDFSGFIREQQQMSSDWVSEFTQKILSYNPDIETIIAGLDDSGGHIYVINGFGSVACKDSIGFAAIGYGEWHARSQFMFAGHTRFASFPESILLTYVAKKRAEVAPGVGRETDMFIVPKLGGYVEVSVAEIDQFNAFYSDLLREQQAATGRANAAITKYVAELVATAAQITQTTNTQGVIEATATDNPTTTTPIERGD